MRPGSVVVTGVGVLLPGCSDRRTFWSQVSEGRSQLTLEPDPSDPSRKIPMGRIRDFDPREHLGEYPERHWSRWHREQQLMVSSLLLALRDAELRLERVIKERVGIFDGTSRGSFGFWYDRIRTEPEGRSHYGQRELILGMPGQAASLAAAMLGVRGAVYTFNGSCSSGAIAIGHAFRELQAGRLDVAFGTGHDVPLLRPIFEMYKACELVNLSAEDPARALRPYVDFSRNVFSEGAVTLVLERREHAEARGATVLAELAGYEYGNTGQHPSDVDSTGLRPAQLIEAALAEAGVSRDEVGFVVGHGNAAPKSDNSELQYMRRVFGSRTAEVPLISVKPIFGHCLGASSAVSLAAATLMIHHSFIAPTINVDERRIQPGFNHQANRGRADRCEAGLVVSYGIGGQNSALLVRRPTPRGAA